MRNMTNPAITAAAKILQKAMTTGNEQQQKEAFEGFTDAVMDQIRLDYEAASVDQRALQARGYRLLTTEEKRFYEAWITNAKASQPQQAFTDILNDGMPLTIINDVFTNLTNEHPLLDKINFVNVGYMTRWMVNDHSAQTAAWGEITDAITKQITSGFRFILLTQCKLSAFAYIPKDLLEMGASFLDQYVRTILLDAYGTALEAAAISGTGLNMPIGMDRNIAEGATFSTSTGYAKKTAVEVTSFMPKAYGALIAQLAKTEADHYRIIKEVTLICNPVDYFNKIMPATTVLNMNGTYNGMVFPFPTDVVQSAELSEGEAILCLPKEYTMAFGTSKGGNVKYDDSYKFLEDLRTYIIKGFANGRCYDNTSALLLDISDLEEAYIQVKAVSEATAAAEGAGEGGESGEGGNGGESGNGGVSG